MYEINELIRCATLAPSGHNTQPWRFQVDGNMIRILPDTTRRLPVVDPDDHALYISLGCALENLVLAAGYHGYWVEFDYEKPGSAEESLRVRLARSQGQCDPGLYHAIAKRQTNRRRYDGRPLPEGVLAQLVEAATGDGVRAIVFPSPESLSRLTPYVAEASRLQFSDPEFVGELLAWIRFARREADTRRDGLSAAQMGLPAVPRWLGSRIMRTFATPESEAKRQSRLLESSSAALLFATDRNNRPGWVELGRAFERTALVATHLGLQHAHVNMPCEVVAVREQMRAQLGLGAAHPLLLIRFGYAAAAARSLRRPAGEVMAPEAKSAVSTCRPELAKYR